jgi:capsular polysaccharide biosynthesis protein
VESVCYWFAHVSFKWSVWLLLGLFEFLSLVSDYPKLPPVKEQLELWSSHGVVVSAHGAGLMNLLLMPQMSAVVEVFPVHFHHNLYRYLAALTGVITRSM